MAKLIVNCMVVLALVLASHVAAGGSTPTPTTSAAADLPPPLEAFRNKVAAMNAKEVLAAAITEFGRPTRDVGSGESIPQWDVAGGALTVHPFVGPTFKPRNGKTVWLIPTSNAAQEILLQDFEMTTLPDPVNHGTRFWIGNVRMTKDGAYRYVDGRSNLRHRGDQSKNFFIAHPEGRVEITWPPGIDARSPLEALGDRQIARLRFTASDGEMTFECGVASSAESRHLSIVGATFEMEATWLHFWPKASGAAD